MAGSRIARKKLTIRRIIALYQRGAPGAGEVSA